MLLSLLLPFIVHTHTLSFNAFLAHLLLQIAVCSDLHNNMDSGSNDGTNGVEEPLELGADRTLIRRVVI